MLMDVGVCGGCRRVGVAMLVVAVVVPVFVIVDKRLVLMSVFVAVTEHQSDGHDQHERGIRQPQPGTVRMSQPPGRLGHQRVGRHFSAHQGFRGWRLYPLLYPL